MIKLLKKSPDRLDESQGHYTRSCARFEADFSLSGLLLSIDIGMFVTTPDDTPKVTPAWQIIYPVSAGVYSMSFVGLPDSYKNHEVEINVIDKFIFEIEIRHFMLNDYDSYLEPTSTHNLSRWISPGGLVNVYDSHKYLSIKATADNAGTLESATADILYNARKWNTNCRYKLYADYTTNPIFTNNWIEGKDLTIILQADGNLIKSEYFCGIFNVDPNNNNIPFYDDLKMEYAEVSNSFGSVAGLSIANITEAHELKIVTTTESEGYFTIKKDYFKKGECYRVFWIYQDYDGWHSCMSDTICMNEECDPIYGDTEYYFQLEDFAIQNGQNIAGIAPCQTVKFCISLDKLDWKTKINALGFSGEFNQYIQNVKAYKSDTFGINVVKSEIETIIVDDTPTSLIYCVEHNFNGDNYDQYITIEVKYKLASFEFTAIFPFHVSMEKESLIPAEINELDMICADEAGELTFTFIDDPSFNFFAYKEGEKLIADTDFTGGDATLTYDMTDIAIDDQCCICVVSQKYQGLISCPCWKMSINWHRENNVTFGSYNICSMFPLIKKITFWARNYNSSGGVFFDPYSLDDCNGVFSHSLTSPDFDILIILETTDGCIYFGEFTDPNLTRESNATIEVWMCNNPLLPVPIETTICHKKPRMNAKCVGNTAAECLLISDSGTVIRYEYSFDLNTYVSYTNGANISFGTNDVIYFEADIDFGGLPCGIVKLQGCVKKIDCLSCSEILDL